MIIKRYLWRELLFTFGAVFLVLVLIMAGHTFVRYMGFVAEGRVSADMVLQLFGIKLVKAMGQLLPFAWFISVTLTFGRLYKDNEMTIFSAVGLPSIGVLRLVMGPTLLCAALVALFTFYLDPLNQEHYYKLTDQAATQSEMSAITAGRFNTIKGSDRVFYVESISDDKQEMYNIFIQGGSDGALDVFSAPRARQMVDRESGDRYLVLQDGYRFERDPVSGDLLRYEYEEASIRIEQPEVTSSSRKRRAYPTEQLWLSDDPKDSAELHWRLAMPLSVLLLSLLAVLLSYTTPREGRFGKLFIALLAYIVYSNLLGMGKSWVAAGKVDPLIGLWWIHLLAVLLVITLYVWRYGGYELLPQRFRRRK
ncbi:MAG: LPS export ABC transporter permease LptF [Gammaproteobacteria bacterium]|nr:LPS export ABC transporter permease LptF [Gammaproteobacteria bacterium]MCF6230490.1 LPS export ABC transporter permease LptF [Gammaproteobacteria bacterium]